MADETAIVGIGCRFPGANCLDEYWDMLVKGENHVVDIPPERWNKDAFLDSDVNAVGKSYSMKAGLLKNYDHFDNKLFKINDAEAAQMDPQQRQVLECTYMALEDAGITRQQVAGQKVGVYIGSMTVDYADLISTKSQDLTNHTVTGQARAIVSNRVSYVYNLTGPSMTIDTACSSSLVALHQAGLALRAGDCSMAICGGVNLTIHPGYFIKLSKAQMLSPTGQCHSFSANADGYTRGEGCGIIIVKLLSQALHDGDNIWGTIVTGLNQDGRQVTPITAPSGKQQEELLNDMYTQHGINPTEIDYIEAHGTGTKRGDPVEATALGTFFEKYPRQRHIGSVKTNIGHLEAAAGVAGLIKVLLMMKHDTIVPSLHFDKPNEAIDFDRFQFVVPTENTDWKRHRKIACVNSFGFGGSNSHAVLTSFTMETPVMNDITLPVCFSGSSEKTLDKSIAKFTENGNSSPFSAIAYTSCMAREHFPFRKAFFANNHAVLKSQIEEELQKRNQPSFTEKENVVFVFCGMGTAWEGMCNDLISNNDQFKKSMLEIDKSLSRFVQWSLMKRLLECDDVDDPLFGPIAIFACQVSLAHLWETWGVKPAAVVGQSVGEVAAAHVAGILSLDEAVRVIYHRTRILAEATGGKMMLVRNIETEQVKTACKKIQSKIDVALYYSPVSCTISGDEKSVLLVKEDLKHSAGGNALFHELPVTSAFHSHFMDSARVQLDEILSDIKTSKMTSRFVSTVDPDMDESTVMSKIYWGLNVRSPVRFCDAIKSAAQTSKKNIFVEIGPRTVLKSHLRDIFRDSTLSVTSIPSLHVKASYSDILHSLVLLYDYGVNVKWDTFFPDKMQTTSYPSYVFNSKPLLVVSESKQQMLKGQKESEGDHLFIRGNTESASLVIDPQRFKSVFEHKVKGAIILPGAVHAEAALTLARMIDMYRLCTISVSVAFRSPVNLKSGTVTNLEIEQSHSETDSSILNAFVLKKGKTVHAEAIIRQTLVDEPAERVDLGPIKERCTHYITGEEVYQHLANNGFSYGEMMSVISGSQTADKESLTVLEVGSKLQKEAHHTILHPAILDGMLQTPATVTHVTHVIKDMLPYSVDDLIVKRKTERKMLVHLKVLHESESYVSYSLSLLTTEGYVIALIGKFTLKAMGIDSFDVRSVAYTIEAEDIHPEHDTDSITKLVMFSDEISMSKTPNYPWTVHHFSILHDDSYVPELRESSGIVVMFQSKPHFVDSGMEVEKELEDKIMPLRSLILKMSQHAIMSPLLIVTMATPLDYQSPDRKSHALACIHEGIRAYIRCVRREFIRLNVRSLDLNVGSMDQYDATLIMSEISQVLKVKGHAEFESLHRRLYGQTFQREPNSTPPFRLDRKMTSPDTVLYSTSSEEISQPFFTVSRNMQEKGKDDILLSAHCVAVHSKFLSEQVLYPLENGGYKGISKGNPVVTFESTGFAHRNSRRKVYVACYPQQVRYEYYVPMKFALNVKHLGGHFETGDMLKLYCLWRLCGECSMKDVAILYSQQTRKYAEVMEIILLTKQTRTVSLLTPEEIPNQKGHRVLISTTQMTAELAQQVVIDWNCLEQFISLEMLISLKVINLLKSVKPRLKIAIVRTKEFLAFSQMNEHIPKLYTWIRKHKQNISKICVSFRNCNDIALKQHHSAPINIAEILETWEFNMQENQSVTTTQLKVPEILLFDRRGMYLVVGGMTGLGWECVLYLASKGAGCITIISRRNPDPHKQDEMKHVSEMYGCIVTSLSADVQNIKELGSALKKLGTRFPAYSLKGVFFGAAVLKDGLLLEMTRENFKVASSPKVAGSWNLHILTEHLPLDYFVLFSSVTSLFGNAGQANYGAGNGFMDALAHVRRQNGKCGQAVNWGPLNMGMMQERLLKQMDSYGYFLIHKRNIPDCLTHILMLNKPQIIMCGLQLVKFGQSLQRETNVELESRFRSVLSPFKEAVSTAAPSNVETFDFEEVKKMSKKNALAKLVKYVKAVVIDVAVLDESSLDVEQGTRDQGVDSMNFMQITGKIMDDTHVQLSSTKLNVENASVTQISQYIYDEWLIEGNGDQEHEQSLPAEHSPEADTVLLPGEQFVFDNYMRDPNHISHLLIVEAELPDVSEPMSLKKMLQENVRRHTICRTTFHDVNGEARKSALSVEADIDYRIGDLTNRPDVTRLTEERFYLDRQGPVRFVFVKGNPPHLIFVFHRIGFDYQGISVFVNDFMNIGQALSRGQSLSDVQSDPDIPIGPEIRTILQPKYEHIKEFWTKTLGKVPYISFADEVVSSPPQMDSISVQKIVSADLFQRLKSFTDKEGLSRFKCLVGLVQLLWSTKANGQKFAMSTYVDQRIFSPKLTTSVGRGVNFTPLSCEVRDDDKLTVVAFLRENSTMLDKCTENGIFPFGDLKHFLPEDHYHNVMTSFVTFGTDEMRNMGKGNDMRGGLDANVRVKALFGPNTELYFDILNRKMSQTIGIVLYARKDCFSEKRIHMILNAFLGLLEDTVANPQITVRTLLSKPYITQLQDKKTRL